MARKNHNTDDPSVEAQTDDGALNDGRAETARQDQQPFSVTTDASPVKTNFPGHQGTSEAERAAYVASADAERVRVEAEARSRDDAEMQRLAVEADRNAERARSEEAARETALLEQVRANADARIHDIAAEQVVVREFQIGDTATLKKDRAAVTITKASSVLGKKQSQVEYKRHDNDTVQNCWVDELVR